MRYEISHVEYGGHGLRCLMGPQAHEEPSETADVPQAAVTSAAGDSEEKSATVAVEEEKTQQLPQTNSVPVGM